jgi:hypothetical protein
MTKEEAEHHWYEMMFYVAEHVKDETFRTASLEKSSYNLNREEAVGMMYCYYFLEGSTQKGPRTWDKTIAGKAFKMRAELALHPDTLYLT